ncbi:MAG: TonB-dependent receptor [Gemmatimonadetes bacterium]|nr:TonB-dependent receptor [Gemmatimonadota bacterium]
MPSRSTGFFLKSATAIGRVLLVGTVFGLLGAQHVAARQTGSVLARAVNAQTGEPLAGVQVTVLNTQLGGITDNQGRFLMVNVPVGEQTVLAQLLGFGESRQQVTVTAGGSAVVNFNLFTRAVELEGVVVTGTAIAAQRREVGNSIALITSEQIRKVGAVNFEDILRGRALGVSVTGTSGTVGAGSSLLLRGTNSVNGRNAPLIYIDGVRMPSDLPEGSTGEAQEHASFLGSINPEDIERIEIIKGAAASVLYGTEASAGVIQIFTKKGQAGAPRWTFSVKQGLSRIGHVGPEVDPTGLHVNDCTRQLVYDSVNSRFDILNQRDPGCPSSGSWLRDAHVQEYQLSARGGSESTSYYMSGSWNRSQGVVAPQGADNLTLRANLTFDGFRNFRITLNSMLARRDITWVPNGDNAEGLLFNVARGDQGETPDNDDSLVLDLEQDQFINHFNTSANISWSPSSTFRHRMNVGLDYTNSHFITERPWQFWNNPLGDRATDIENRRLITVDYAGSWFTNLRNEFTSNFSWGGQYNQNEHLGLRGDTDIFVGPGDKVLQNGQEFFAQEDRDITESGGFFFQEQIGWNNRLFITGGFRADTHSSFGDDYTLDQQFTIYPRLQATYTFSDHAFWPRWWQTFRVRAAYGESGEPPDADDPVTLFQVAGADDNKSGFIIVNQGNPDIGPERTKELEAGFDGTILNGRVNYTATWYKRRTSNGRIFINPPPSNGIAETIPQNVGKWDSRGIETALDVIAYESPDLRISLNGSYQWNETIMRELGSPEFDAFNFNYLNGYREGLPIPSLFGKRLLNGDSVGVLPVYTDADTSWHGPTRPPHEISLGATVTLFNRLTVDAFGVGQYGHVLYDDLAQEMAEDGLWPGCYPINARVNAGDLAGLTAREIGRCSEDFADNEDWVEDADYFRLQSATVSYRLPEQWLPGSFTAATIQLQATNLFTITNFSGLYPDALLRPIEQTARGAGYILPPPRTYTINVRLNF